MFDVGFVEFVVLGFRIFGNFRIFDFCFCEFWVLLWITGLGVLRFGISGFW